MQFLAIMKANSEAPTEKLLSFRKQETIEAWKMMKADVMRALWYVPGTEGPLGTVAILECSTQKEAEAHCSQFPLVVNNVVTLDLIPLGPCTSYELLFAEPVD